LVLPVEMKAIMTPLPKASSPERTDNANTLLSRNTLRFGYALLARAAEFKQFRNSG
jgi:hypothetical protein